MLQRSVRSTLSSFVVFAAVISMWLVPEASAASPAPFQKLARKSIECPSEGFKFRPLGGYDPIPVDTNSGGFDVLRLSKGAETMTVLSVANKEAKKVEKGKSVAKKARPSAESVIMGIGYIGLTKKKFKAAEVDETLEIEGLDVHHLLVNWTRDKTEKRGLDIWIYPMDHADIYIVYFLTDEIDKKAAKVIRNSARSFELIDRVAEVEVDISARTYASQIAWAEQEAAKTPGWRVIGTPSERFVILTSSSKKAFIDNVIERLEVSRDVFEADFAPPEGFNAVSVVRICADQEQFRSFGNVPDGVAGYFSPRSVELVLYDNVEEDRNATYAVISHEAFHQYCHFLFNQSEAHRWFDEGQGDYYGGMKVKGGRGKITPKMPAGLDRLGIARELVRTDTYTPLEDHLNFNHKQWSNSNGKTGVGAYAQSWSIIYMLRQGALRKVSRKVWKDEYAEIIPNYVSSLTKGFEDAYESIRKERIAKAKKKGKELDPSELRVNRFDLDPREKKKIWKAAIAASWGQINLEEFEENWKLYVKKFVK